MSAPVGTNRPGLDALVNRAGTYGTFMQSMIERLGATLPEFRTREPGDPSIALLDGWAVLADILTFYQERITNEGYLRTANEKRSLLQFASLVGYRPRPGVAASAFLAYTLEQGGAVTLAPGSKAQSVPGPGETAQTFETADALDARNVWNVLGIRTTRPQNPSGNAPVYLTTITTNLKPNDLLLFVRDGRDLADPVPNESDYRFVRVATVEPQPPQNRTKIMLQGTGLDWDAAGPANASAADASFASSAPSAPSAPPLDRTSTLLDRIAALNKPLLKPPSAPPPSPERLTRTRAEALGANLDVVPQLFAALHPELKADLYAALADSPTVAEPGLDVYAFRLHAAPYGHNAPPMPLTPAESRRAEFTAEGSPPGAESEFVPATADARSGIEWPLAAGDRNARYLSLDARYDRVAPGSFVAIRTFPSDLATSANDVPKLFKVGVTLERSRRDYGLSATTTVLALDEVYFRAPLRGATLAPLRDVDVYAQSERLTLADVPIESDIPSDESADPTLLELDGFYDGLAPGRWAIVAGTRTDLPGVRGAERVMIAATEHRTDPTISGDAVHTFVTLSTKLNYTYARASVTISGNVVRATQGETRNETIGSGDASQARQSFTLKAKPLTFVSSPTQSGAASTLTVRVNGVRWPEADDFNSLGPTDRAYTTATTDAGTTVTFGDGLRGARLPTGTENITATYRVGLGTSGNVAAGKVSLLMSRPLGVKNVVNPVAAAGGVDSESRDDMRRNIPTALLALDRIVSLDDYENFARTFAGVAKAKVARIGAGRDASVYLTLAGPDNATIDPAGDVAVNLAAALRSLGDPLQSFASGTCDPVVLLVGARVDILPNYQWETIEPAIRAALAATFGFAARDFGQPAYKSEALAAIANVPGVVDVALDLFAGISAATLAELPSFQQPNVIRDAVTPLPARAVDGKLLPAQLVALDPDVSDTVFLSNASVIAG